MLQTFHEVKDESVTLNTAEDWRLLVTSIGVTSSVFTKGNIEGINAPSSAAGQRRILSSFCNVYIALRRELSG